MMMLAFSFIEFIKRCICGTYLSSQSFTQLHQAAIENAPPIFTIWSYIVSTCVFLFVSLMKTPYVPYIRVVMVTVCRIVLHFILLLLFFYYSVHFSSFYSGAQNKGYGTFFEEALRIFTSLQELENVADPIAVTQVRE